jgi:hypothetical protein
MTRARRGIPDGSQARSAKEKAVTPLIAAERIDEPEEPTPVGIASPWLDEPQRGVLTGDLATQLVMAVRAQRCFVFTDHAHPGTHFDWNDAEWNAFADWAQSVAPQFSLHNWHLRIDCIAEDPTRLGAPYEVRASLAVRRADPG